MNRPQARDGLPQPQRRRAMLVVLTGLSMSVLDGAIANIALPTIATELRTDPASAVWVVNAYQLAVTISLLPFASLGELRGYRRVFVAGLAVFTLGSLACALSGSLTALVASRILQGFGGAGLMSVNTALLRFIYPADRLGSGCGDQRARRIDLGRDRAECRGRNSVDRVVAMAVRDQCAPRHRRPRIRVARAAADPARPSSF
jgi:hypothetical protein